MKLLCLMMVWRGLAADELLGVLADAAGDNRVSLCVAPHAGGRGTTCPGVLWRGSWVLTRASCLEGRYLSSVLVLRDCEGFTCEDLDGGRQVREVRRLRARVVHPEASVDLALLALDRRYWQLVVPANVSSARHLGRYAPWMEDVYNRYPMDRRRVSYAHKSCLFSSPLRMFMTTILVPSVTFVAIFIYVIFFTGTSDEIPYKNLKYEDGKTNVLRVEVAR